MLEMQEVVSATSSTAPLLAANAAANAAATISLTSAAPRGPRGSSRGSSGGESSEELQPSIRGVHSSSSGGEDDCSPMDLSGAGGGGAIAATPTVAAAAAATAAVTLGTPFLGLSAASSPYLSAELPLLNARKLAEFVKAQHLAQKELNETTPPNGASSGGASEQVAHRLPKKRPWPQLDLSLPANIRERLLASEPVNRPPSPKKNAPYDKHEDDEEEHDCSSTDRNRPLNPLELIRAKLEMERSSPDSQNSGGSSSTPPSAAAVAPTFNGNSQGREVKKRRLDALLSRKFSVADSPPKDLGPATHDRPESAERRSQHRRKQANPTTPSPPMLSLRPTTELFPAVPPTPPSGSTIRRRTPTPSKQTNSSMATEPHLYHEEKEREALKREILQLQLAQAALLGGAAAASGNNSSLLYYGYYAQMLQGLQAQQHKLVERLVSGQGGSAAVAPSAAGSPSAAASPPPPPPPPQSSTASSKSADEIVRNLFNRGGEKSKAVPPTELFKMPLSPGLKIDARNEVSHE